MKRRGLRLDSHKSRPLERPIRVVPPPATLVLALDQGSGDEALPVVRPGEAVRAVPLPGLPAVCRSDRERRSRHRPLPARR